MQIAVIGMNQDTAPIEIRNRVAYVESNKIDFITQLLDIGIAEVVILGTCGRNEIYLCDYKTDIDEKIKVIIQAYSHFFNFPDVKDYLYVKNGNAAVQHLYSVTAGLDSIVLGEDQILGQVKEAHYLSMELGASKKILNRLFRDAVTTSKRIKTQLKISEHPMSISSIGVKFLLEQLNGFKDKKILIIGTGKMGKLALEYTYANNPETLYMTNRNHEKVFDLKKNYPRINYINYTDRHKLLNEVDAVITATSSPHYVIKKGDVNGIQSKLFILDLAVPQDVANTVSENDNVVLYNVDSLNKISAENERKRQALSLQASQIIDDKLLEFNTWLLSTKVDPMIKSLNMLREIVEKDTLEYIHRKLNIDTKERVIMDKIISASLKRMIRNPIIKLKEIEDEKKMHHFLEVLNELYGFDGD